jgi:hypothetical protein
VSSISKGDNKVALNLDTLEREDRYDEFASVIGGRRIVFTDAAELDWQVLAELDSPEDFIENCTTDEDREHILKQSIPGWKFRALWEAYQAHYGLGNPGNARA